MADFIKIAAAYGLATEKIDSHKGMREKIKSVLSFNFSDIEYNFSAFGGFKELEGIHELGDWDLSQHQKYSGVNLEYLDEKTTQCKQFLEELRAKSSV